MVCRLCGNDATLKKSHIIPRSYFKSLKSKGGQLISVTCDDVTEPKRTNSDPKEKLLCEACESFLSDNYERYGTRLFKDTKNVNKTKKYIEFNGFKFKEYYLFLISILWRASVSSMPEFSAVDLGRKFEEYLESCLKNKSIKLSTALRLEHIIKISVLRVVDNITGLEDDSIRGALLHFGVQADETKRGPIAYYFMTSGFLITYYLSVEPDLHALRTKKIMGQITNRPTLKVPKVEITNLKQVYDAFDSAHKKAQSYDV
ncbi:hypothetical protein [Pseudoalteromonas rubra]|uniref:hypothetical protein n=1 Tax=Pseudoalteromonas rubra TaxID=43658 RepID=UPI002DBBEC57|nr:hypothetical protein [Pseudoalteromonas rubra]MEC4090141.1 hypothetical protein [Pseudoalteromonas rubra]